MMLWLCEGFIGLEQEVRDARTGLYKVLLEDAWRIAMRSQHYLTVQCLDLPCDSAWMQLYEHGTDINFLRASFSQLLIRFSNFYYMPSPACRGRPPKLRYVHQVLGLLLCFYVDSMEQSTLCMLFGLPPSTLSRTLRRAEEALAQALDGYAPARIA